MSKRDTLTLCVFNDASGNWWRGYYDAANPTNWNGFDNVWVEPDTWAEMLAKWKAETLAHDGDTEWLTETAEERPEEDGLVYLGHGLCMEIGLSDEQLQVCAKEWRAYDEMREHCPACRDAFIFEAQRLNTPEATLYRETQEALERLYVNHGENV